MSFAEGLTDYIHQLLLNLGLTTSIVVSEILASIIIFLIALFVGWIVYNIIERYFTKWTKKTKTKLDDEILSNIKLPIYLFVIIIGIYYALEPISFLDPYDGFLTPLFMVFEVLVATFAITRVVNVLITWYAEKQRKKSKQMSEHILFIMKKIIHAIIYLFAFLFILYAFNIDLSGALVGLGIGGIAIAFALQNVLSDVFSAFTIYFDKPFEIGDYVVLGDDSGTIKKIGIKSTRIQTLQGEELIVSNHELVSTRIRNFKKMRKRRVVFTFGVIYNTPLRKLKMIPEIITKIITDIELADIERIHFKEYGDFSLKFETIYYIRSKDYAKFMDVQQEINFKVKEIFEKENIEMAFPTQTIYLEKDN